MSYIRDLIDRHIAEHRGEWEPSPKFRVSDAGRCHLMRYWKRQGKEPTDLPDERALRVFEVGHMVHRWIQDILEEKGVLFGKEILVEDEHRIGHVDAVVMLDGGPVLFEFKTVHSRKFHYQRRLGFMEDTHYFFQAATYAMMIPVKITETRIVYVSKDDLHIEEVTVPMPEMRIRAAEDWGKLIEAWEEGREPEPNPLDWECRYCIYRSTCDHNNNNGGWK